MKVRFQLDPASLVHFRTRRQLTLRQAAECLRKTAQQESASLITIYHRIEKTGTTSRPTAERIAGVLNVTIEQLQGQDGPDEFLWWVVGATTTDQGRLVAGYIGVWNQLRPTFEDVRLLEDPEHILCTIDVSPYHCAVTFSGLPHEVSLNFRPARRTDNGLEWAQFTAFEQAHWHETLLDRAMDACDQVQVNWLGNKFDMLRFPRYAELGYELAMSQWHPRTLIDPATTVRTFHCTEDELLQALQQILQSSSAPWVHYSDVRESAWFTLYINGFVCTISRVCRDDSGAHIRAAPWRRIHAVHLETLIEAALEQAVPTAKLFRSSGQSVNHAMTFSSTP